MTDDSRPRSAAFSASASASASAASPASAPPAAGSGGAGLTDLWSTWAAWAQTGQRFWSAALAAQTPKPQDEVQLPDPDAMRESLLRLGSLMIENPTPFLEAQAEFWRDSLLLWERSAARLRGQPAPPVVTPAPDDRRFKDEAWSTDPLYDTIKQSYLLSARTLHAALERIDGLPERERQRLGFYVRQMVDALAPTNFVATNPAVRQETLESGGRNLLRGLENLIADLERGDGRLRLRMVDESAFEVGGNLAVTPGKVVYQNDLMQLIQYSPTTETVARRPVLVVPPWINKFYILDLTPKNSLLKYMVDQGFTVFVISWVNPDPALSGKAFEDYMAEGPLAALEAIAQATGERDISIVGYCIGGTLTACTLAHLAAKGDDRIKDATLLTTLVDFEDPGELGVFIEPHLLTKLDEHMARHGHLDGRFMATAFSMLRDNDLIWSFYINNYLLGKDPMPFDLLYWNGDSTRMPAMMHTFYLRRMYERNELAIPDRIVLLDTPIDLRRIGLPVYMLSTREDHITPWRSTYRATAHLQGPLRFVLAGSGHVAGVVNPPSRGKYGYWVLPDAAAPDGRPPADAEAWLAAAQHQDGSWWPDWIAWLSARSAAGDDRVPAASRIPGAGALPALEDAPGSYVKVRA